MSPYRRVALVDPAPGAHPQVAPGGDIQVIADPRLLDLRTEGIDLAVRFGRAPHPDHLAMRLMGDRVVPVCTPELPGNMAGEQHRFADSAAVAARFGNCRRRPRQRLGGLV